MSLKEEARRFKSRLKTGMKSILGRGAPLDPVPNAGVVTPLDGGHASSQPSQASAETIHGPDAVSWAKLEGWTNLKGCLDTLRQIADASGLGPLKVVVEGLMDCAGAYEDAAQGRRAYTELRSELEIIFQELRQYATLAPTVAMNVSDICVLIQNEIDRVKSRQAKSTIRRLKEAEQDQDDTLECYKRIRIHLQTLSRKMVVSTLAIVEQHALDDRLEKLAPALSARYDSGSALKLKRGPCTQGTRVHVLDNMYQWTKNKDSGNIYWMSGMAGTGKTTIAYSLCERLDPEPNRMLAASFFCSRLLPECRNVSKIIPSIAYQLAQRFQPFGYALYETMKKCPEAVVAGPSAQFESLLVKPLSDPKVRIAIPAGMVVVIDALDECDDVTSTQQILDAISNKSNGLPIKFMVSSRPEATIRDQMVKNGSWADARVVLHELDSGEVQMDIRTYLKAELAPMEPSEEEVGKLVDRAGLLFIYAATVVRYVGRDSFRGNPRARLQTMLDTSRPQSKTQTKDIDQLYQLILEAATNNDELEKSELADMKLVLHTVVCTKASLTVSALNALLRLDDIERVNAALRPLWSVLHVMGQEMTVTTLHASFPDYLMDHGRSGDSVWHCDAAVHHHILAEKCLECIRGTTPQFNICQLESSYLTDNEVQDLDLRVKTFIPVELRYACRYWSVHLCASESSTSPALIIPLEMFLTKNLLLWMEVINLTRDMSVSPSELTNVSGWATRHGASQDLILLIQDAWRFATTMVSNPVGQSTPHIYVSVLPFLPSHSPIRKHYGHRMHGMVVVKGMARDRRKGRLGGWVFKPSECAACPSDCNLLAIVPEYRPSVITLMDVSSGRLVRDMSHESVYSISCLAFSPDGTRVASGTVDGCIWVWDHSGQLVLGPLTGHSGPIRSTVYSHNGAFIISGSDDCTIRVWDAKIGNLAMPPLLGHTKRISCIAISPDDTKVITGSSDETVRVWDMQSGCPVFDPITEHTKAILCIAASPNGKLIATGSADCSVRVWDNQTGQAVAAPFYLNDWVSSVVISSDNLHISVGLEHGTIQIWDVLTGQPVSEQLQAHLGRTKMLAYSPDGTRIISYSNEDGSLCVFDAHNVTATVDTPTAHPEQILSIDISPDSKHIVSGSDRHLLRIWDRMTGELIHGPLTGHTDIVHFVRYSADSHRILSCSYDGTLRQWDAQTGDAVQIMDSPITARSSTRHFSYSSFDCATYSPDGGHIATASSKLGICIWSSSSGEMVVGPMHSSVLNVQSGMSIMFSKDGMTVITGWKNGTVEMWNAKTGKLVSSIQSQLDIRVSVFAFSADGMNNVIAKSYGDGTMQQRITQTGDPTHRSFHGHTNEVSSAQYSPDGTRIVSGSHDKTVHIWNTQSATSIFGPLEGHTDWVNSVAYSPDGTFVASASDDTTIRIWDATTQSDSPQPPRWDLKNDGWVTDEQSRRLIWVPPDLNKFLLRPRNTMVLSLDGYVQLKFDGARIGEAWVDCWKDK